MAAEIIESNEIYAGFIRLLQTTLRLDDCKRSTREIIVHGSAAAVLPYDPVRRVVMLVKLLRAPILFATGAQDLIEAPAGMIDRGSPEETAKREALEETGLRLAALEHYWLSLEPRRGSQPRRSNFTLLLTRALIALELVVGWRAKRRTSRWWTCPSRSFGQASSV